MWEGLEHWFIPVGKIILQMTPNCSNLGILRFFLYLDLYILQAFSKNIWIFENYFNSWIEL